jgi:YidC/Oxa1 family membrane protein insertase
MAQEPNRLLRLFVPLIVVLLMGGGIFFAVYTNTNRTSTTPPAPAQTPAATNTPAATPPATAAAPPTPATPPTPPPPAPTAQPSTQPATQAQTTPTTSPALITGALHARAFPFTAAYDPIGSLTPKVKGGTYEMEVRFTPVGAGIDQLALANVYEDPQQTSPEIVQSFRPVRGSTDPRAGLAAMAANRVEINGAWVALCDTGDAKTTFWKQIEGKPGHFEAVIENAEGNVVARITRAFDLQPGAYEIRVHQSVENLSGAPMTIRWEQFGPVSPPVGTMRYGGDVRRIRFGFILPQPKDPRRIITADDRAASMIQYSKAIGAKDKSGQWQAETLWPNDDSRKNDLSLAWAGISNRYFSVAIYPLIPVSPTAPAGEGDARIFTLANKVDRYAVDTADPNYLKLKLVADIALVTTSTPITAPAGQSADVSMGVYAGPTSTDIITAAAPMGVAQGLQTIVIYTLGGTCAFCTFQVLTGPLHSLLQALHDFITHDWALAIILLVVCVRTILHPITRWTQRRMFNFSKEMAKIAPKMKAIQEKYKNDPAKLREEQTRMMGEHGAVYASGALGCLPAFLQSPVWIALSSMIAFSYELHNQHAFFGIFQKISPSWSFLADLGSPDRFIPFGHAFSVPLLGEVDGLNILPVLLGVVFFIQQKYLTPPPTAPLTPEQEQQQKIMKVMTVVMFPLMMYNTPAGLTLYFATNSTLAILEIKLIRRKAEEDWKEREAVKAAKLAAGIKETNIWNRKGAKLDKPEGFLARLRRMAEEAQKNREQQQKRNQRGKR